MKVGSLVAVRSSIPYALTLSAAPGPLCGPTNPQVGQVERCHVSLVVWMEPAPPWRDENWNEILLLTSDGELGWSYESEFSEI